MSERNNLWGGSFEIIPNEDQAVTEDEEYDRAAYCSPTPPQSVDEVKQSWLLRPEREKDQRRKKKFIQGKMIKSLVLYAVLAGLIITLIIVLVVVAHRRHHHHRPPPTSDNYIVALHQALTFFNAQRSGGASIPKNKKTSCQAGHKWRDSLKPNPNIIVGAMVGGPDRKDGFRDSHSNYNYTEPTIAGNAGLVAALVALSSEGTAGIDRNTMFYAVPPMFTPRPPPPPPPPSSPWIP